MTEVKRMNRLWSNESLFLKDFIDVPIYDSNETVNNAICSRNGSHVIKDTDEPITESVEELFKRIDQSIKATTRNVKKLEKNIRYYTQILSSFL